MRQSLRYSVVSTFSPPTSTTEKLPYLISQLKPSGSRRTDVDRFNYALLINPIPTEGKVTIEIFSNFLYVIVPSYLNNPNQFPIKLSSINLSNTQNSLVFYYLSSTVL